jgi:hypothetical protein
MLHNSFPNFCFHTLTCARKARRFAKAMRASLIFSSTSHSINVQKVYPIPPPFLLVHFIRLSFHPAKTFPLITTPLSNPDLQNCPLQSLRPQMHNPRDRKRRRAPPPLPIRRLDSLPCHTTPNLGGTRAIIESLRGGFGPCTRICRRANEHLGR